MQLKDLLKTVGRNVARIRNEHSATQRDAAKATRITYRYFQHIEAGKVNMTLATLDRLAKFLNVEAADLLSFESSVSTRPDLPADLHSRKN